MALQPDKIISLYKGTVKIAYYDDKHWYKEWDEKAQKAGKFITSVTGVSGQVAFPARIAMPWAVKQAREFLLDLCNNEIKIAKAHIEEACRQYTIRQDEASFTGSQVHKWAELYIKSLQDKNVKAPPLPKSEAALNGVNGFLSWLKQNKIEFIESERLVYSKKHHFVGTLDAVAKVNGKISLIDFKTSNYASSDMCYQVAGYQIAYEEETGKKLTGPRYLLRFDKERGNFDPRILDIQPDDYEKDCAAFLGLLTTKKRQDERKNFWKDEDEE